MNGIEINILHRRQIYIENMVYNLFNPYRIFR